MPWGAAIGAVGALGAAAINKKGQSSTGGSSSSDSPETIAATNTALSKATDISNRGYTPYTGQVVQGLSDQEKQGQSLIDPNSTANTKASSLLDQAAGDINGIKQYNTENLKSYMDPYVSSVLTPQLEQENIDYNAQKSALANNKAGAFGGDRAALAQSGLDYAHKQTIAGDVGNAYSKAYTNAQQAFFQDASKQMNAAKGLQSVSGDVSKLNEQQYQDLMSSGGLTRALGQKQLDFNLSQFLEQRDWSVNNLSPLLSAIDASKGTQRTTNTYSGPNSGVGQAIGAAATIAGAYFTGGKSTGGDQNNGGTPDTTQNDYNLYSSTGNSPEDMASDVRLKTDIVQIGHLPSGLPLYEFRYLWDPDTVHVGVLAHEAAWIFPQAVREGVDGYLRVRYDRIH